MNRKDLTKTFMMISNNLKTLWSPWFIHEYFGVVRVIWLVVYEDIHPLYSYFFEATPFAFDFIALIGQKPTLAG